MKKTLKALAITIAAAVLLTAAWKLGRSSGIEHTLADAEFLITSFDDAYTEPDGVEYDTELHITPFAVLRNTSGS